MLVVGWLDVVLLVVGWLDVAGWLDVVLLVTLLRLKNFTWYIVNIKVHVRIGHLARHRTHTQWCNTKIYTSTKEGSPGARP